METGEHFISSTLTLISVLFICSALLEMKVPTRVLWSDALGKIKVNSNIQQSLEKNKTEIYKRTNQTYLRVSECGPAILMSASDQSPTLPTCYPTEADLNMTA